MAEINSCTPCHARVTEISPHQIHSTELLDNYIPEIPTTEHYHADGQANDEDFNYTSFAQSKMFRQGVKCSSCHEPHTAKMLFPGNQLCLQCHTKTYDAPRTLSTRSESRERNVRTVICPVNFIWETTFATTIPSGCPGLTSR